MSTTSEATREFGGAESKNNNLKSSAGASTVLLSHDNFWAGRSVEAEDVPRMTRIFGTAVSTYPIVGFLNGAGRVSTTSEATIEIGGADSKNNDLNSSAVASTDLLSDDSFWAGRSVEAEDVPRSPSSKFLPYFEVTWLLVILGIICVGGISALIGYYNYYKSDQSLDMTRKINELASSVTALEERVATISDDQARQEVAQRRAVEASKIGFQRTFGQLSDRLDKLSYRLDDVRNEAKERDAGMALRLQGLEANELTPAATPATPQPTASTSPTDSAAPRTSPSDPVAAVNSPSAPVDSAKKDAKRKKHKKLPEHA